MADEPTTDAPPDDEGAASELDALVDQLVGKVCEFRRTAKPQALIADELTDTLRDYLSERHVEQLDGAARGLSDDEIDRERAAREAAAAEAAAVSEPEPVLEP